MQIDFSSKVTLVTGGAKGIGRAVALAFAASGASVVVADMDTDASAKTAAEIRALGAACLVVEANVADPLSCQAMVQAAVTTFGQLDIQINNAGISHPHDSLTMPSEYWQRIIDINLGGVFYSSQAAARQMVQQSLGGVIISLASISGALGFPGRAPYCASKAGVIALTQVLACEWAEHNIRVNAVAPGYIQTDLVDANIRRGVVDAAAVRRRTPLGRLGTPDDVANAIVLLCSDQASYITGETLYVDGGWTAYGGW